MLLNLAEWIGAVAVAMIAGISPKFTRTKLVFKYPRREGVVALGVFGFGLLTAAMLAAFPAASIGGLPGELTRYLEIALISLVPVGVALWRRKQPVRSAGWGREKLSAALQLGLALAFFSIFLRGKFSAVVNGLSTNELEMLLFCLVVSACEETIFRGYIQPRLASWWGETPGWLAAAACFVIWQAPRLLLTPELIVPNGLLLVGQSVVAGYIMQRSGHALAPALYRSISTWLLYVA